MEHLALSQLAAEPVDPSHFSGGGTLHRFLASDPDAAGGRAYRVHFETGSRTHWHRHTGVQLLCVLEGSCLVQARGEAPIVAGPGDVVRIERGEEHWHGATSDEPTTHLAINLGRRTEWLEPVEDG